VDPSACNNEAIKRAALYGHTEVVKLLLKDARVDKSDILILAAEGGHVSLVLELLNPNKYGAWARDQVDTAIDRARFNGHSTVAGMLQSTLPPPKINVNYDL
jgi:hypothetical protein